MVKSLVVINIFIVISIGLLLVTNHPGFAIRASHLLFILLVATATAAYAKS